MIISSPENIKQSLLKACADYLDQRIATSRQAIAAAQDAANDETKSSSGDKYETGRAMMQLEIEKNTQQLAASLQLKHELNRISTTSTREAVGAGSLVHTSQGLYFIAISLGKVTIGETQYFVLAPDSPLGVKLMNLRKDEGFDFNSRRFVINAIW